MNDWLIMLAAGYGLLAGSLVLRVTGQLDRPLAKPIKVTDLGLVMAGGLAVVIVGRLGWALVSG